MKIFSALFLAAFFLLPCCGEIVIVDKGKAFMPVIYADKADPVCKTLAEIFISAVRCGTGVTLKMIPESRFAGGKAIFIGPTRAAAAAGITIPRGRWSHKIEIRSGNIWLLGQDSGPAFKEKRPQLRNRELGTLKAVITFLEKFAGACFFGPAALKEYIPSRSRLAVPEKFSYSRTPQLEYGISRGKQLEFDVAVNSFYAPWLFSYGGHSHPTAVPAAKYFKSHPEYFALRGGKRNPTRFNYLCISNPAVQKLILDEVIRKLDAGYLRVQLGQGDAFKPCECKNCRELFGLRPKAAPGTKAYDADPVWGEKIWIFHRDIAEKVHKMRPGKEVQILAYPPNREPPETFSKFPSNAVVELAPYYPERMKKWSKITVPGGFTVYLYNWGFYKPEGFFPKMSYEACKQQAKDFYRYNIRGIYRCGYGEQYLEEPTYYIWGKLLDDPELKIAPLLKEFCTFAYPKAAKEMEAFFKALNARQQISVDMKQPDWADEQMLSGLSVPRGNQALILLRFPENVLRHLDSLLKKAEAKENSFRLRALRTEWNYCLVTARCIAAFSRFRKTLSEADWQKALARFKERKNFIAHLPWNKQGCVVQEGAVLFGRASLKQMIDGGRVGATLYAPYHWDPDLLEQKKIIPGGRVVKVGDKTPQYLIPQQLHPVMDKKQKKKLISFTCTVTDKALCVWFVQPFSTYKEVSGDMLQVVIGPDEKNLQWFPGRFRKGSTTRYIRVKTNRENNEGGDVYASASKLPRARIFVPAPGMKAPQGAVTALMEIPFDRLPRTPQRGEKWIFNVIGGNAAFRLIWEPNFDQKHYRQIKDKSGTIIF